MPQFMVSFFKRWVITTISVWLAASIVPGITWQSPWGLLLASLVLGLLNAIVRPVMVVMALPLVIFTLGLFMLVINALLLWVVGVVLKNFQVDGFASAFWGSLIISIITMVLNSATKSKNKTSRFEFRTGRPQPRSPRPPDDGGGPIIDV